ncbi:MAG TPA: DegV family protein [Candidatus Limiplasma sp.]|nr:DegV family protein [Candidatus Limiplasma sp.]
MKNSTDIQQANGADVFRWFSAGAREVYTHVKHLNIINVFPVADGDTGTNLAVTLRAMVEQSSPVQSFHSMLQTISRSALAGARGNSGIIFASYINGLALESGAYESVSISQFSAIALDAVKHLYTAVDNPREGTLMSVIRDWANYLQHNHTKYHRFNELFADAYSYALQLLKKTKEQMEVLRKHNVVDAGAAGFVRFLEGINRVLSDTQAISTYTDEPFTLLASDNEVSDFRYCTEALVDLDTVHAGMGEALLADVKARLHPLGDSLIANARGGRLKAHIHTNSPELVMEALSAYGQPAEQKADDMALQTKLRTQSGVGLITDSIADLPDAFLLDHGVSVLPIGVLHHTAAYLDKLTIKLPQLFQAMDSPDDYPTSSQPEPARIHALLKARLERFDSLIILSVADQLSGTYQALVKAAKALQTPEKRITVIDTRLNSGAQGLLVKRAAELIAQGRTHDEVVSDIETRIPRTKIYVCLNTLAYAVRGGRVPDTIGKIGMKLGLRPIMTLDAAGHGAAFGVAFSQKGLTRRIMRLTRRAMRRGGIEAYSIVHGGNLPLAEEYQRQLTRITGQPPAFISPISAAVALHSGPGTVAVCFTRKAGDTQ